MSSEQISIEFIVNRGLADGENYKNLKSYLLDAINNWSQKDKDNTFQKRLITKYVSLDAIDQALEQVRIEKHYFSGLSDIEERLIYIFNSYIKRT